MTREHYRLIKLQIDLIENYPYGFDHDTLNVEDFELENLITNFELYIEMQDLEEMENDNTFESELKIIKEVQKLIIDIRFEQVIDLIEEFDVDYSASGDKLTFSLETKDGEYGYVVNKNDTTINYEDLVETLKRELGGCELESNG